MNLRDHDKPCQHVDEPRYKYHAGSNGDYWWCEICPGGAPVTTEPDSWCETHDLSMYGERCNWALHEDNLTAVSDCRLEDPPQHFTIETTNG